MRVFIEAKINVFDLFLHDRCDVGACVDTAVANYLTRQLNYKLYKEYDTIVVDPPSENGLSRFVLIVQAWSKEPTRYLERYYTKEEFVASIPADVAAALADIDSTEVYGLTAAGAATTTPVVSVKERQMKDAMRAIVCSLPASDIERPTRNGGTVMHGKAKSLRDRMVEAMQKWYMAGLNEASLKNERS